jgi:hypothetical protein
METMNAMNIINQMNNEKKTYNLLIFSSFIFITNTFTAFYRKYYIYGGFFIFLTITSIIYHYDINIYTNLLDKSAILAIFLYGSYILYKKTTASKFIQVSLIITGFILCVFFYYYGYYTNSYCNNPDKYIGKQYHCLLHFICSLLNHLIIFL